MDLSKLTKKQQSVFVGLLLSDGYLTRSSSTGETRFGFELTAKTKPFFDFCYVCFKDFITEQPREVMRGYKDGPKTPQWVVRTRYLPVFTQFYNLFYTPEIDQDGKTKWVHMFPPVSFLKENLNNVSLAVLLLGDGSRKGMDNRGYEIHSQGNGFESSVRLCLALYEVFGIQSWPTWDAHNHKKRGLAYWNIYISSASFQIWAPKVESTFRQCEMYEAKMPNKPKRPFNKNTRSNKVFAEFYQLFGTNREVRENISYKLPQAVIDQWRNIQKKG